MQYNIYIYVHYFYWSQGKHLRKVTFDNGFRYLKPCQTCKEFCANLVKHWKLQTFLCQDKEFRIIVIWSSADLGKNTWFKIIEKVIPTENTDVDH